MHTSAGRRTILITALILFAAGAVHAQVGNRAGFFVGANFAGQGGDMDDNANLTAAMLESELGGTWSAGMARNPGAGFGGFYIIQTSPTFAWQIEGQFIERGSRMELTGTGVDGFMGSISLDADFELKYFEIPVLARFSPSPSSKIQPLFFGGPVIGFLTSATLNMSGEGVSDSQDVSDECTGTMIGLLGGVGCSMAISTSAFLTVQGRYYVSLTEPFEEDIEAKSGDFGLFAGVEFALGR